MQRELLPLQGLGKLEKKYLYRLISRTVTGLHGIRYNGASSFELLAVIYLSQIADPSGHISQFKISDFSSALGCSEREAYVLLSGLVEKAYITSKDYSNKRWTGCRDITLLNNNFSKTKYDKTVRYLNTFHSIFDFSNPYNLEFLRGLSLYALRLLVFLLFSYNYNNGYNTSAEHLCEILSLKNKRLINIYLKELEPLFGKYYEIKTSKRRTYGYVHIYSKNSFFIPETSPSDKQLSYYKRKWLLYFINSKCSIQCDISDALNTIFSSVYFILLHGSLSIENIEDTIRDIINKSSGIIDQFTCARIRLHLELAISSY